VDKNIDELELFTRMVGLTERGDSDEKIKSLMGDIMGYTNIEKIKKVIETELVAKYKQLMVDRIESVYQELVSTYRQGIHEKRVASEGK